MADLQEVVRQLRHSGAFVNNQCGIHIHVDASRYTPQTLRNLIDSVIIPAMEKYSILVKTKLDIQNREVQITVGRAAAGVITIESDLPNIIKKSVTIKQVSADVNKLVIYDSSDYETKRVY